MKENIKIRVASTEDAGELLEIYKPYVEHTAITFEYEVPDIEEFTNRIKHTKVTYPYLVAEYQGEIMGYAYAGAFKERVAYDWSVETSIYVRQNQKRMGVGSLLYEKLEEILKKQGILNMNACIAYPQEEDPYLTKDSVLFHEKFGYSMVGKFHACGYKFNRWYDMVWMEKMIGEHLEKQTSIIPFSEIEHTLDADLK